MEFCKFLKGIDFFGKLPEFYIKGRPKQATIVGRIFTIIFIIIYIIIFIYKLYRMFIRLDITFYDSYSTTEEAPSINITNENFYLLFSVYNDSGLPFIDESVYYPVAYFVEGELEKIELEKCNINKIGSKYRKFFRETDFDNYYCLSNVNYTLLGYINSIKLQLFPCKNDSEINNNCKPKEVIDEFIDGIDLVVYLQDVLIKPKNFSNPVERRITDIYSYLYKNIGQYIYIEIQVANIETNTNLIDFDFLTEEKSETYIRYDLVSTVPTPGYQDNKFPICEVEIQLKDKYFSEKKKIYSII